MAQGCLQLVEYGLAQACRDSPGNDFNDAAAGFSPPFDLENVLNHFRGHLQIRAVQFILPVVGLGFLIGHRPGLDPVGFRCKGDDINSHFFEDQLGDSAPGHTSDGLPPRCPACADPVGVFTVFLEKGVLGMARTDAVLIFPILLDMHFFNVVVRHHDADGGTRGQIIFHDSGKDEDPVLFNTRGIQRSLARFAFIQFLLDGFGCNLDPGRHPVHDGQKTTV